MYSKYNSDKKRVVEVDEEENKFNDISIVMELLMNLLAKDFIDFGPEGESCSATLLSSSAWTRLHHFYI